MNCRARGTVDGNPASIFIDDGRIRSHRSVFVCALIARAGRNVVLHLAKVAGIVPPWPLIRPPAADEHNHQGQTSYNTHPPTPYSNRNQNRENHAQTKEPAPGELHE